MSSPVEPVPTGDNRPPMPDPARVVTRSLSAAQTHGIPREEALGIIAMIAAVLYDVEDARGSDLCWWVTAIQTEANARMRAPRHHKSTGKGSRHDSATAGSNRRHGQKGQD